MGRTDTGQVVLTLQSSQGHQPFQYNGQNVITTLFTFSCQGQISMMAQGRKFAWQVDGSDTIAPEVIGGDDIPMVLLMPSEELADMTEGGGSSGTRKVKRNKYTEGRQPRCGRSPPELRASVRPGARGTNPNGCGGPTTWWIVPDFDFGSACDAHDDCFGETWIPLTFVDAEANAILLG